jgi:hypothetical protein
MFEYRRISRVNRVRAPLTELPFDVRLQMLRKSQRKVTIQRFTATLLWGAVIAAVWIIVATELIAALVKA